METIIMPIEDILDLHTFSPREVPQLLDDYFAACIENGLFSIRVIHGKGSGALKKKVQSLLSKHPLVVHFTDAPPDAGGWGATLVELKRD